MTTLNQDRTATGRGSAMLRKEYRDLLALRLPPGSGTDMPGTPEWAALPADLKAAAVVRIACLWLDEQVERVEVNALADDLADDLIAADALIEAIMRKRAAIAVALAQDYQRPSLDELQSRRSTYIERPPVDPDAVRRWVASGTSTLHSAPTAAPEPKGANAA